MKRLLMTGLLGLTLINHVHAGSLTQYLPTVPAVKDFATGAAIAALPLVARAALMVPYASSNEEKIVINEGKIKQTACAYINPLTNAIDRAKTAFGSSVSGKYFCQKLDTGSLKTTNDDDRALLAAVYNIENARFALNTLVGLISTVGLVVAIDKIAGFQKHSDSKFVSKLMTSNATATGFALICAASYASTLNLMTFGFGLLGATEVLEIYRSI